MDSRTGMEKVYEVKFTTATSGGWEHATGRWAAGTSPPPWPRPGRPAPRLRVPRSRLPPARRPSPSSRRRAYSENAGSRWRSGARNRARAPAPGGLDCACARGGVSVRRTHAWLGYALRPMRAPGPVFYGFSLSQPTDVRISSLRALLQRVANPFLLCKPPS